MAHTDKDDLLMEDDLAAAFLNEDNEPESVNDDDDLLQDSEEQEVAQPQIASQEDEWDTADDFPGQLAVDVYETADKLIVKARVAGVAKSDLNVSIDDNILTISGVLSGGEDEATTRWHIQECYWGEFSRTIALPVQVRDEEGSTKATLREGVLTITFEKARVDTKISVPIE